MSGTLYIVGTPIGNLGDLSPRAAKALAAADVVLAEDTRVTSKLLAHLDLHKPLERCDENVIAARAPELLQRLEAGETLAFCSDAGMPCISDPGTVLVDAVRSAADADVRVEVIPGPTAVATALAASGLASDAFFFGGFLPRKAAERERLLTQLAGLPATLVFYESPHRTLASIDAMAKVFPQRRVCLARELTKLHEEELIGTPSQVAAALRARDGELKGEVVLLVEAPGGRGLSQGDELSRSRWSNAWWRCWKAAVVAAVPWPANSPRHWACPRRSCTTRWLPAREAGEPLCRTRRTGRPHGPLSVR